MSDAGSSGEAGAAPQPVGGSGGEGLTSVAGSAPMGEGGEGGFAGNAGLPAGVPSTSESGAGGEAGSAQNSQHHVYSTITALYDALDSAQIVNGDTWTVDWSSDARVGPGTISGVIAAGAPKPSVFDQGVLPLKLFAAKDWVSIGPTGTASFDADGYPSLQVPADAANWVEVRSKLSSTRYAFGRFTQARLRISQDVTGATDFTGVAFTLWDAADENALIGNHFVEVGGATMSVAMDYYSAGTQSLSSGSGASSTRIFDGLWTFTPAQPFSATLNMNFQLFTLANASQGQKSFNIAGHGDWSANTALQYSAGIRVSRAPGGSGVIGASALTFQVQRYMP